MRQKLLRNKWKIWGKFKAVVNNEIPKLSIKNRIKIVLRSLRLQSRLPCSKESRDLMFSNQIRKITRTWLTSLSTAWSSRKLLICQSLKSRVRSHSQIVGSIYFTAFTTNTRSKWCLKMSRLVCGQYQIKIKFWQDSHNWRKLIKAMNKMKL